MINRLYDKHWMPEQVVQEVQKVRDEEWKRLAEEIIAVAEAASIKKTVIRWGAVLLAWGCWLVFSYMTRG